MLVEEVLVNNREQHLRQAHGQSREYARQQLIVITKNFSTSGGKKLLPATVSKTVITTPRTKCKVVYMPDNN